MEQISIQNKIFGAVDSRIGGRQENQDSFAVRETPLGMLVVVCDGMGGGPAGKTASSLAAETIVSCVASALPSDAPAQVLDAAVKASNQALNDAVAANRSLTGMGTTCVCVLLCNGTAYIAHVGDSRCYLLHDKKIKFRTQDHSQVADLVRAGTLTEEQARISPYSNIITRAIGIGPMVEVEIDKVKYNSGDRFALMTDGIWGTVAEPILVTELSEVSAPDSQVMQMVERTDNRGVRGGCHHDNLTLAVIDILPGGAPISLPWKGIIAGVVALCVAGVIGVATYNHFSAAPVTATSTERSDSDLAAKGDGAEEESFDTSAEESEPVDDDLETSSPESNKDEKDRTGKSEPKIEYAIAEVGANAQETTSPSPSPTPDMTQSESPANPVAVNEMEKKNKEIYLQIYGALNTAEKNLKLLTEKPKDKNGKVVSYKFTKERDKWNKVQQVRKETLISIRKNLESISGKIEGADKSEIKDILAVLKQKENTIVIPDKDNCHPTKDALDILNPCIHRLNALKNKFE